MGSSSFISDFNALADDEHAHFFSELVSRKEWQQTLISSFNSDALDLEPVSRLLVALVHSYVVEKARDDETRLCILKLVPSVVCAHLRLARPQAHLDALVLALVHMDERRDSNNSNESGNSSPNVRSVRMLSALSGRSSIYHDANNLDCNEEMRSNNNNNNNNSGTIRSLFVLDQQSHVVDVDRVTAQNRCLLLEHLLRVYNGSLSDQTRFSLDNAVRVALQSLQSRSWPLISSGMMNEWLYTAYFCMYNVAGSLTLASRTIDLIRVRASLMASAQVLLTANAIRTLMLTSPPQHKLLHKQATSTNVADVVVKAVAASTSSKGQISSAGKKLITNASFRAKKISDDIVRKEDPNLNNSIENSGNTLINHSLKVLATMPAVSEDVLEEMLEKGATPTLLAKMSKEEKVEDSSNSAPSHKIKEKLMLKAKLPNLHLRKRTMSTDVQSEVTSTSIASSSTATNVNVTQLGESKSGSNLMAAVTKRIEKKTGDHLRKTVCSSDDGSKSVNGLGKNESSSSGPTKKKNTNGTVVDDDIIDSMEKVEALIQMKKLPSETITIHSPGSGTTLF